MQVALRKESVDRNGVMGGGIAAAIWSLSARRAWIKMGVAVGICRGLPVALRKESVDRN